MKSNIKKAYRFRAIDPTGHLVKGVIFSQNKNTVYLNLLEKNLHIISCTPASFLFSEMFSSRKKIKMQDLLDFCLQMQYMSQAGVPVLDALLDAKETIPNMYWVLDEVISQIRKGKMLSEALYMHQKIFPEIFFHIIELSEQSGDLSSGFKKLYEDLSWKDRYKKELSQTLRYPLIVLGLSFVLIWVLSAWVVPQLQDLITMTGSQMPTSSQLLLQISNSIASGSPVFFGVLFIFFFLCVAVRYLSEEFRVRGDKVLLKIPFINDLWRNRDTTIFLHTLKVSLSAGLDLLEALKYSSKGLSNAWLRSQINKMYKEIKEGKTLFEAFQESYIFDSTTLRLIRVGEVTGQLQPLLKTLEEYQIRNSKRKMQKFLSYMQPAIFGLTGVLLLWVVLSIFYPIYDSVLDVAV